MSPLDFEAYLVIAQKYNVAHFALQQGAVTLNVTLAPSPFDGTLPGVEPTPGGWKGPERLDNQEQFEPDVTEVP